MEVRVELIVLFFEVCRNSLPIVLFERHCHVTEKSEAIAHARRCRSSRLTRWWTQKRIIRKMEGRGGEEAQGVADPPKKVCHNSRLKIVIKYVDFQPQRLPSFVTG
jgi:hypothetical protein